MQRTILCFKLYYTINLKKIYMVINSYNRIRESVRIACDIKYYR